MPSFSAPDLRPLAVFDFDDTLIEGDSLWSFFFLTSGYVRTCAALAEALAVLAWRTACRTGDGDRRTLLKSVLLRRLLKGRHKAELCPAIEALRRGLRWKTETRRKLMDHYAAGDHVVIATGSLNLYMPELLEELPHHALICTNVAVENGVITGAMPDGNCVRQRKAELVQAYMASRGPFGESWGYGNLPHDLPMLNLVKHRIVV